MPESQTAPPTDEQDPAERIVRGEADSTDEQRAQMAIARANAEGLPSRADWSLPVRHQIDGAQLEVLRHTVAKDCNNIELAMFLEVATRYGLDPFLKEIYAAKFDGGNGGVTIFTGRDGLLKAARLTERFVRMHSAVVRANDEFEVITQVGDDQFEIVSEHETDVKLSSITRLRHKRTGMGSSRGEIVGSYALVWRAGDPEPWYAEASWEDYGAKRQKDGNNKDTTWTLHSRKGFPEAMMRKVAESIVLRLAFGIAGIVGSEELGDRPERVQNLSDPGGATGTVGTGGQPVLVEYGDDDLGRELRELAEAANELLPGSWRPAKLAMRVNGKDDEARVKLRDTLRRFVGQRNGGRERLDAIVKADAPVKDAEVVQEPAQAAEEAEATGAPSEGGGGPQGPQEQPETQRTPEEAEEVTGEVVPEEELPEYSQEVHSALVDEVMELRGVIEGMGDEITMEREEAARELATAEEQLRRMNLAAEQAGQPTIEA